MSVILLPWIGAVVVWQMGLRPSTTRLVSGTAVFFTLVTVGTAVALLTETRTAVLVNFPLGSQFGELTFVADGLAVTLTLIAAVVGALAVIFSLDYMRGEADLGRYYALILLFIGAMAGLDFFQAIALGILCNALVCLAVWLTYSARSTVDKIAAIIFPITAFVAAGFEHSVANMYFVPTGLLIQAFDPAFTTASGLDLPNLTWGAFLINNLIPVTIGNIFGFHLQNL